MADEQPDAGKSASKIAGIMSGLNELRKKKAEKRDEKFLGMEERFARGQETFMDEFTKMHKGIRDSAGEAKNHLTTHLGKAKEHAGNALGKLNEPINWKGMKETSKTTVNVAGHTGNALKHVGLGAGKAGLSGVKGASKLGLGTINLAVRGVGATRNNINAFFVMVALIHIADAISGFRLTNIRFVVYLAIALYGWLGVFSERGAIDFRNLWIPLGLSALAFGFPFIKLIGISGLAGKAVDYAIVFLPWWPLYLMFLRTETEFLKKAQGLYFVLIVLLPTVIFVLQNFTELGIGSYAPKVEVGGTVSEFVKWVVDGVKGIGASLRGSPGRVKDAWDTQVALATGDYYTGQVDENQNEPLGVYIEDIKLADPEVYEDEPVAIFALLKGKNLDPENDVSISVSCNADGIPYDYLRPADKYVIETIVEADLDCGFRRGTLNAGPRKVSFLAAFNFETMAYIKSYFIDKENMRALIREDIDVFDNYGIRDRNPIAVYTNGPVMIGMEVTNPPVQLDMGIKGQVMTLGITIDNRWEGRIKKVSELIIILPENFALATDAGTNMYCGGYVFEECDDISGTKPKECDKKKEAGTKTYVINQKGKNPKIGSVDVFKTLRCGISIEDPAPVLGGVPLSTHFFKVTAKYDYILEKYTIITVKEVKTGFNVVERYSSTQWKGVPIDRSAGEPEEDTVNNYMQYQPKIKNYVTRFKANNFKIIEMEALMAAVISQVKGLDTDVDEDGFPDYLADCWRYKDGYPDHSKPPEGVHGNDVDGELQCLASVLKTKLQDAHQKMDAGSKTISDGAVKAALANYSKTTNPDGDSSTFANGAFTHFLKWKNALAEEEATAAGAVDMGIVSRMSQYSSFISGASSRTTVPAYLIKGIIAQESAAKPDAVSSAGARGLMQVMQSNALAEVNSKYSDKVGFTATWQDMFDPQKNILVGTVYFKYACLDRFNGNVNLALACYDGGPTRVSNDCCPGGTCTSWDGCKSKLPSETQGYVPKVLAYASSFR